MAAKEDRNPQSRGFALVLFSWVGEMQFLAGKLEGASSEAVFSTARGHPSLGCPHEETVPRTVSSPPPELWDHQVFRFLRKTAKGSAFGIRKLLKKFDQNFHVRF